MNTHPAISISAFNLAEYEAISTFIATLTFSRLAPSSRQEVSATYHVQKCFLERVTAPQGVHLRWSEFCYRGQFGSGCSYIEIFTKILGALFADFPDRQEAMATAMGYRGRRRHRKPYVAATPEAIFPGRPAAYAYGNSRMFSHGWYVHKAISSDQMLKLLESAVSAAGLTWGRDVVAPMRSGKIPVLP